MYSSVIEGKGCVLGDDMGLGKTVQVCTCVLDMTFNSFTDVRYTNSNLLFFVFCSSGDFVDRSLAREVWNRIG
jgi:hypothetical protein